MKICIVSNLYPPYARGGAEQIARRVCHELYKRGHEVFVISSTRFDGMRSLFGRVTDRNVEAVYRFFPQNLYHMLDAHRFPFIVRIVWHLIDLWSPFPRRAVAQILKDERPDVILSHNLKGLGLQSQVAIRASGIPQIHTIHDVQLSVPSGLLIYGDEQTFMNRSFVRRWYEREVQSVIGSPNVIVSPSQFLASFYRERGFFPKSRVEVIPNPAPSVEIPVRAERAPGPVRILFAGQLEEHKGVRLLLEALNASDVPFELHIAGEGSLSAMVSAWADRDVRVTYHGFVSLENLIKLFAINDVVVVPSLCYENSPTVIYECFESGVPVIASRIGGVGELVEDGVNGYLVTPGSRDELVAAIKKFTANLASFRARSDEIKRSVEAFALPRYVDRIEGLINDLHPGTSR